MMNSFKSSSVNGSDRVSGHIFLFAAQKGMADGTTCHMVDGRHPDRRFRFAHEADDLLPFAYRSIPYSTDGRDSASQASHPCIRSFERVLSLGGSYSSGTTEALCAKTSHWFS